MTKSLSIADEIGWALRPFGGAKVDRYANFDTDTVGFVATVTGAKDSDGKSIRGQGQSTDAALKDFWEQLTHRSGSYILIQDRKYVWASGLFQEIL